MKNLKITPLGPLDPSVPSCITPIGNGEYEIQFTMSRQGYEDFQRIQVLLAEEGITADLSMVLELALEELIQSEGGDSEPRTGDT